MKYEPKVKSLMNFGFVGVKMLAINIGTFIVALLKYYICEIKFGKESEFF